MGGWRDPSNLSVHQESGHAWTSWKAGAINDLRMKRVGRPELRDLRVEAEENP
jgi:hypothetical protein